MHRQRSLLLTNRYHGATPTNARHFHGVLAGRPDGCVTPWHAAPATWSLSYRSDGEIDAVGHFASVIPAKAGIHPAGQPTNRGGRCWVIMRGADAKATHYRNRRHRRGHLPL